jgi:predicted transcriptional regulator
MKTKCPVAHDEAKHDRLATAYEVLEEIGREQAEEEFARGELDDEIRDAVADECNNAVAIALHHCYAIRGMRAVEQSKTKTKFRETVDRIISQRAIRIAQDS